MCGAWSLYVFSIAARRLVFSQNLPSSQNDILAPSVSIVIPTYGRDQVLIDTISSLIPFCRRQDEILIVDQTVKHEPETQRQLDEWSHQRLIEVIDQSQPSIPKAMNTGLRRASNTLVLFLDDDVIPVSNLILRHSAVHASNPDVWATVGQVVQPWQSSKELKAPRKLIGLREDFDFPFHSILDHDVTNVMAGNLCVNRERLLAVGGFDENFQGSAYRFETEVARRIIKAGGKIRFVGSAGLKHLRVASGGTRKGGNHLTSASPHHGIGDHYYAFLHGNGFEAWKYSVIRVFREVCTKFHLTHPWWIPVKILGELRAMVGGYKMAVHKKGERRVARRD